MKLADLLGVGVAEGIDGGEVFLPLRMVIVPGEDPAGPDFFPPLAQGFAAFVALMGVAVDRDRFSEVFSQIGFVL